MIVSYPESCYFRLTTGAATDLASLAYHYPGVYTLTAGEVGTDPEDVRAGYGSTPSVGDVVAVPGRGGMRVGTVTKVTPGYAMVAYTTPRSLGADRIAALGGVLVTVARVRHDVLRYWRGN